VGSDSGFGIDKDCIIAPPCAARRRRSKLGTEMRRLSRPQYENAIYHVVTRGDGRRRLFQDEGHYERFTDGVMDQVDRCGWSVIAFCRMPNHIHASLSGMIQGFSGRRRRLLLESQSVHSPQPMQWRQAAGRITCCQEKGMGIKLQVP